MSSYSFDGTVSETDEPEDVQEPTTPTNMTFLSEAFRTPTRGHRTIVDGEEMSRLSVSPAKLRSDADLLPSSATQSQSQSPSSSPPPTDSSSSCFSDIIYSTPHRPSSQSLRFGIPLHDERKVIEDELGDYTVAKEEHVHALYKDLLTDSAIDVFLEQTDLYDNVKAEWSALLALLGGLEKLMYAELLLILEAIIKYFVDPTGLEREVSLGSNRKLKGAEARYSSPDFVVRGTGPSFQSGKAHSKAAHYSNLVAWFDGKREDKMTNLAEHLGQANIYVRHLLAHQPNRMFVRCLVISERHVRAIHYDRAGHEISPLINIHRDARTFVRLIVGLTSKQERVIGLDDTIRWTIGEDGQKLAGTVTIPGPKKTAKVYEMLEVNPIVHRHTIRGRGTVCWRVKDPETGQLLVIKDSWRSSDRTPEHTLLRLVEGFKGVGHIVGDEYRIGETIDFRCKSTHGHVYNRLGSRIVLEGHGKTIDHFKSALQFLLALFDAMDAHRRLYTTPESQILHRDVSVLNVLLGKEKAVEGDRGILIDLDMAIKCDLPGHQSNDPRSASNFWRSLTSLEKGNAGDRPAHDYLDDLESFFYLLLFILICFYHNGTRRPLNYAAIFVGWDDESPKKALFQKLGALNSPLNRAQNVNAVSIAWGDACGKLVADYGNWVIKTYNKKSELLLAEPQTTTDGTEKNPLESLLTAEAVAANYEEVLGFVATAIEGIKATPPPAIPAKENTKRSKRQAKAAAQAEANVPIADRPKRSRTGKRTEVAESEAEGGAPSAS